MNTYEKNAAGIPGLDARQGEHILRKRTGPAVLATFALVPGLILASPMSSASAASAASPSVVAHADSVVQTGAYTVVVNGWGYARARRSVSISLAVWVDGKYVGVAYANRPSTSLNASHHLTGAHALRALFRVPHIAKTVTLRLRDAAHTPIVGYRVRQLVSPGARVVAKAKQYVGKSPYVEGGSTPRGFDCSGYVLYVYRQTGVANLPHNAEQQRLSKGMRLISRSTARPGDLVFYLSDGRAYHVAVYAGHGMQYAAATARDGIRYQSVWSSAVQYRTDWH